MKGDYKKQRCFQSKWQYFTEVISILSFLTDVMVDFQRLLGES